LRTSTFALSLCCGFSLAFHWAIAYWPVSVFSPRDPVAASAEVSSGIEIELNYHPAEKQNTNNKATRPSASAKTTDSQKSVIDAKQKSQSDSPLKKQRQQTSSLANVAPEESAIKKSEAIRQELSPNKARKSASESQQSAASPEIAKVASPRENTGHAAAVQQALPTAQPPASAPLKKQDLTDDSAARPSLAVAEVTYADHSPEETSKDSAKAEVSKLNKSDSRTFHEESNKQRPASMRYQMGSKYTPKPRYPIIAVKRRWQGQVVIAMQVLADGTPAKVSVKKGSGFPVLDKTAVKQLSRWRLAPSSSPLETIYIPVIFKL